jgi:hypothetical protein
MRIDIIEGWQLIVKIVKRMHLDRSRETGYGGMLDGAQVDLGCVFEDAQSPLGEKGSITWAETEQNYLWRHMTSIK